MATETVNTIWPEGFESEPIREDSITGMDLQENAENRPLVYKMSWGGNPVWSFAKGKREDFVGESPYTFHATTGVINGNIPEPKADILVRVARDVIEKCKVNRSWDELNTAIELAKTTYTTLKKIELFLEKDPEIPDRETLRFILTVSGNPEQILAEEDKFKNELESSINPRLKEIMTVTYYWG